MDQLIYTFLLYLHSNPEHLLNFTVQSIQLTNSLMNTLSVAVQKNSNLHKLILKNCKINDEGSISLSIGLQSNSSIVYVDLSSNELTGSGIECLIDCIIKTNVTTLILSHNLIEDISILNILKESKLSVLDLSYNLLKEKELIEFLNIIQNNSSIKYIGIEGYQLTKPLYEKLCIFIQKNDSLVSLSTTFNFSEIFNFQNYQTSNNVKIIIDKDKDIMSPSEETQKDINNSISYDSKNNKINPNESYKNEILS